MSFVGVFPPAADRVPARLVPVWSDRPGLWLADGWHPGEVRTARHRDAGLLVLGQCFADDARLLADLRRAVDEDRPGSLTRWPGCHTVVVVRDSGVTVLVDQAGQYPVFHRTGGGRVVFGSHGATTAAVAGLPATPDRSTLLAGVFCPDVPALVGDRSVLVGVRRLGGGGVLTVDRSGTRTAATDPVPGSSTTFADGVDELRAALDAAVAARLADGRTVTADFSGGMDSTSLAFLAARHAPGLRLFAYHHPDAPAHDLEHARRYAGDLRLEIVTGTRETLSYQGLFDVAAGDEPDPAAVASARAALRLGRIGAGGLHLGGEGADALLVPPPSYLGDLARHGWWRGLARDVFAASRARNLSPTTVFRRSLTAAGTSTSRALRGLKTRLEHPRPHVVQWLDAISRWPGPGAAALWLTPRARRELAGLADEAARDRARHPVGDMADHTALHDLRTAGAVQRRLVETARPYGVWPHAPFLDADVIRACTRVAAHLKVSVETRKPLLRAAMADRVPDAVFTRRDKGDYTGEDYLGLRVHASTLVRELRRSAVADLDLVDPAAVIEAVDRAGTGAPVPFPVLNRLLGVEVWLRGR
ncbi:lasso peptide isopeptide bond-forming cyclase [Saccharothrix violaceirubra]|uniref:albusnodin/ikarugamycin family macrolactam cyclase n=1 Tax=Saccharothrix violaceirubra TaxID=413306 RepID=UPI0031EB61B3